MGKNIIKIYILYKSYCPHWQRQWSLCLRSLKSWWIIPTKLIHKWGVGSTRASFLDSTWWGIITTCIPIHTWPNYWLNTPKWRTWIATLFLDSSLSIRYSWRVLGKIRNTVILASWSYSWEISTSSSIAKVS